DGVPTGTWSSSNTLVATIDPVTGVWGSVGSGSSVITATNQCGSTTYTVTVSVPSAITGVTSFCQNATTTLSNAVSGGTWTSGNTAVATTSGTTSSIIYGSGPG